MDEPICLNGPHCRHPLCPEHAPAVTGLVGHCDLCGKARVDLELYTVINGVPQYLCEDCQRLAESARK